MHNEIGTWAASSLNATRYPIWQILLGIDSGHFLWAGLIITLMVYNGFRWLLTTNIAPMRDAEDRGQFTPALIEYRVWLPFHRVTNYLYWVSLVVGLYTFLALMTVRVYKVW
jgi:hypothetical protein